MVGPARAFLNPALFASVRLLATPDPEHKALTSVYYDVPSVDVPVPFWLVVRMNLSRVGQSRRV
jgi:hypothetical protein